MKNIFRTIALISGFLTIWWLASQIAPEYIIPSPISSIRVMKLQIETIGQGCIVTAIETLSGLLLAMVVSFLLAIRGVFI